MGKNGLFISPFRHEEPQGVEKMGLRIPLGIQILCGRFFPPTLGKVPANPFSLENLNLATFDDKKKPVFYNAVTIFSTPCGSSCLRFIYLFTYLFIYYFCLYFKG